MANKIRYGLKNVYYSKLTQGDNGVTYATPVAIPGAVSLEMSPEGDTYIKYADNIAYYVKAVNNGYSGTLEVTVLPETFRTDILGEKVASGNDLKYEVADGTTYPFALLFQFEGDENATRYVLYNCTAQRPTVNGATVEDSMEAQDETFDLTATPLVYNNESIIKARALYGDDTYNSWFSAVTLPTAETVTT